MDEDDQFELEVPIFIELRPSSFAHNDLGVFCTMPLSSDQHLGNYKGKTRKLMSQCADPQYVWTILSSRQVPLFYIDASDPKDSNWLRFIRSTSDVNKYNCICMQQNQQINYFTFKGVKSGDELVTYYPSKKKKRKNIQFRGYKLADTVPSKKIDEEHLQFEAIQEKTKPESIEEELVAVLPDPAVEITLKEKFENSNKLATVDLMLNNQSLTRHITKCTFCPFTMSMESLEPCFNEHIFQHHLTQNIRLIESNKSTDIIENLLDSIVGKIEEYQTQPSYDFKCYICFEKSPELTFETMKLMQEHLKTDHSDLSNIMKCLYCDEKFELSLIKSYLKHLNSRHCEQVTETKLIWPGLLESKSKIPTMIDINDILYPIDLEDKTNENSNNVQDKFETNDNDIDVETETESTKSLPSSLTNESSLKAPESLNEKEENSDKFENTEPSETEIKKIKKTEEAESRKEVIPSPTPSNQTVVPTRTYTCQLCKKQFDQRLDLSKHQCIELNLKLLKKKKDMRKKKWREAHWKRKIDLSYIETTSLTALSQNIADNLSFCIDGTNEDLKAYSREVKDYLNTELGNETQCQMALKSLNLYEKVVPKQLQTTNQHDNVQINQVMDMSIQKKSDSYFVDSMYNEASITSQVTSGKTTASRAASNPSVNASSSVYQCKNCRVKRGKLSELVQHQRECHEMDLKTNFDFYDRDNRKLTEITEESKDAHNPSDSSFLSSNLYATSPIGYLGSDPYAYIINLYWDQKLPKKCEKCGLIFTRPKYRKHILTCDETTDESVEDIDETVSTEIVSLKTENKEQNNVHDNDTVMSEIKNKCVEEKALSLESTTNIEESEICEQIIEYLITEIESNQGKYKRPAATSLIGSSSKKQSFDPTQSPTKNLVKHNDYEQPSTDSSETEAQKHQSLRVSLRNRRSKEGSTSALTSPARSVTESPSKNSDDSDTKRSKLQNLVTVHCLNNKKYHTCVRCGLEFTSANSVFRHQEKSCLRVRVINLKPTSENNLSVNKKKCPICSCSFYSTHRVSIHIYKHHRNLLGSALKPPSNDAKRLHEIQLRKVDPTSNKEKMDNEDETDGFEIDMEETGVVETDEMEEIDEENARGLKVEAVSELDLTDASAFNSSQTPTDLKLNSTF